MSPLSSRLRGLVLAAAVALAGCGVLLPASSERADRAVDPSAEPLQTATKRTPLQIETGEGTVTLSPRFEFDVSAVVASAEPYLLDAGAFLSPVDLVLTWGQLPDDPYRGKVSYNQMGRFYFWRTGSGELDLHYIQSHSSNMHMIPATPNLKRALRKVGGGDRVRITGLLVDANTERGFTWKSSVSREDSGPGACELVWVESLQRGDRVYR